MNAKLAMALRAADEATLTALANKGLLRRANKDWQAGQVELPVDLNNSPLLIRAAEQAVTMPEQGPAQARCDCSATGTCRHILSATLALQALLPAEPSTAEVAPPKPPPKKPEKHQAKVTTAKPLQPRQQRLLEQISQLCEHLVNLGLSHLSDSATQRLLALATALRSADLPRPAGLAQAASEHIQQLQQRHAQADEAQLLQQLAELYALAAAIAQRNEFNNELTGSHRAQYQATDDVELYCLGAWAWQTDSGFHGLSLLFWDCYGERWLSWSDSRSTDQDINFNPQWRWQQAMPWAMGLAIEDAVGSRLLLKSPKVSHHGRLSAGQHSQGEWLGQLNREHTPSLDAAAFTNWAELRAFAHSVYPAGLCPPPELSRMVFLKPTHWGHKHYDDLQQCLYWELHDDSNDNAIRLRVPYQTSHEQRLIGLESADAKRRKLSGVIGWLDYAGGDINISPLILLRDQDSPLVSLDFQALEQGFPLPRWLLKLKQQVSGEAQPQHQIVMGQPLLAELQRLLEQQAESGGQLPAIRKQQLLQLADQLQQQQLHDLSTQLRQRLQNTQWQAQHLLKLHYLLGMYQALEHA